MEQTISQTCQHCQHELKGRSDKKFCNDNCRNAFHNETYKQQNNTMRNITNILRRNRRIIRTLLKDKIFKKVHKKDLLNNGFQKAYHTQVLVNKTGERIYYCFEYGYQAMPDETIKIFYQNKFKN